MTSEVTGKKLEGEKVGKLERLKTAERSEPEMALRQTGRLGDQQTKRRETKGAKVKSEKCKLPIPAVRWIRVATPRDCNATLPSTPRGAGAAIR